MTTRKSREVRTEGMEGIEGTEGVQGIEGMEATEGTHGMESTEGQFNSNGTATCLFPMQDVAPGFHTAIIRLFVEGASSTLSFSFTRTDAPLVLISPPPMIDVEQRSSVHIDAASYAYDPDGQEVFVESAEFLELNGRPAFFS